MTKKITEIYAWICTEPDGGEGLPAIMVNNRAMPLIGADKERMASLRPYAEQVAAESGCPLKLVRFDNLTVLEDL